MNVPKEAAWVFAYHAELRARRQTVNEVVIHARKEAAALEERGAPVTPEALTQAMQQKAGVSAPYITQAADVFVRVMADRPRMSLSEQSIMRLSRSLTGSSAAAFLEGVSASLARQRAGESIFGIIMAGMFPESALPPGKTVADLREVEASLPNETLLAAWGIDLDALLKTFGPLNLPPASDFYRAWYDARTQTMHFMPDEALEPKSTTRH